MAALVSGARAAEPAGGSSHATPRDLVAIYREALKRDPRFRAAALQREADGELRLLARARLLPEVTFEAQYTQTRQEILASDNAVFGSGTSTFPSSTYTLTLTQPLFNWASWQGFRKAEAEVRAADADFAAEKMDLLLRVAERYFEVLGARDDVSSRKVEQVALAKNLAYARQRFRSGLTNIADLSDVKARDALVRASLIEDVARLDDARQGLAELVGWGGMRLMRLDTKMPLPRPDPEDVDVWVQRAMQNNPELVALAVRVEVARREVSVQQGGHFPTVGVTGRHNYRKTEGTLFGGGSEVATTDLSVSLSLPLYRGGATSAAVRQAVKQHARAQEALQQRQREIERQVRAAFEGMRTARSRIEALREGVAAQQVVVEGRRRGERAGVYTQVAVAEAEQDLQAAVRDLTRARYDYLLESLRLKRAAGLLAVTDLEAINAWLR
ncbi:TolC family outer membrane protein [endosymbiont of unidentified scaly snail isolate Monju]|uniref:TolC family outer membrane protein n=1 Tax=endosymbiont of unidentified scaly snail isolate Monju TaxID=1248727 RepID=UPI001494F8C4|nr:TolC family outer membrane protein [endosymbiont of unidentified scaly snail isolate Monju]